MIERGSVVEVKSDTVVVEMARAEACDHCRCCIAIGDGKMHLEAKALPGLEPGDRVAVEVPINRLRAVFLIFVLPLGAVLLGALLGKTLSDAFFPDGGYANLMAIGFALVFVLATFAGITVYERKTGAKGSQPYVIRREPGSTKEENVPEETEE